MTTPEPVSSAVAERPAHLHVVSDSAGYVGTFPTLSAAHLAVVQKYPLTPFLIQKFAVAPGSTDSVWVVLYRDLDAVAFVSNDREAAVRVQAAYASIGLAYDDSIDYWEQPVGVVATGAARRLEAQARAHRMYSGDDDGDLERSLEADQARLEELLAPRADGPLERLLRENERVTILDAVVLAELGPVSRDVTAQPESAAAQPEGAAAQPEGAAASPEGAAAPSEGAAASPEGPGAPSGSPAKGPQTGRTKFAGCVRSD